VFRARERGGIECVHADVDVATHLALVRPPHTFLVLEFIFEVAHSLEA